ncbi:MAG: hypothetical protein WKG06_30555 [Segetibacter sp.]
MRILQMMLAYDDEYEQPIDEVFDEEQQECLQMINKQLEEQLPNKKFCKRKNTKMGNMDNCTIGWLERVYFSKKTRSYCFTKGLAGFYHMYEGWQIHQKFLKNVSTQ